VKTLIHINSNALEQLDVEKVRGDILDAPGLRKFLEGVDVVFHAAGKISIDGDKDGSVHEVNVTGTKNVVEACLAAGVQRLVYFSSIHALQQEPAEELDETRALVEQIGLIHDVAKSNAEREVIKGIAQGLDAIILNPTAAVGPHDYQPSLLGQGLIALYNRKLPTLIDGGFDWVDVRDIAKAAIAAMERGKSGERYVISGMWKTVKELANLVQEITGKPAPKFTSPHWLARMGIPLAKAYSFITHTPMLYTNETLEVLMRCNRNISSLKAKRELSLYPRPLTETLKDTFEWYKQVGSIE
jgi:dihydroflavonol-4-reductase